MLPVITLVGRPNVGKSTLFNQLTRSRDALVADQPGLTRDRQYGVGELGDFPYVIVDTGGISNDEQGVEIQMTQQVHAAIEESDHILFLVSARDGLCAGDEQIADYIRRAGKAMTVVVNKSEQFEKEVAAAEFYVLGLGEPVAIAAAHGRGVKNLIGTVLETLPPPEKGAENLDQGIKIAVIGRPNVGKSTLINRLLGEERVVAFDQPGTTRDSIFIPFEREDKKYTLIDTAGVRRRGRINEAIEKFSVIKTLQAMGQANVVLLVLDAQQGIAEQDATLAGHVLESGRALVVVINKWDGLQGGERDTVKSDLMRKLPFLSFADWHYVSALHGTGVGHLLESVDACYAAAMRELKTSKLTEILEQAVMEHAPPSAGGRRIKLRYAHQGGRNPPIIIIHGSQAEKVNNTYNRYLVNRFRKVLKLHGTPLRIEYRTGDNPYKDKKNKLTQRQVAKRKRLMKHVKSR